ncbi:hypothetical protein SELMODRAFT_410257 [Selaginella moellendorffii]|uniref:Uncharacterized protein n=1 Tax=Selaginella moellendorffii TaxID=88036 RepID=D8RE56_SELML|nr:hypothetical protein SELMODRAFT_410257 [Selaginella moellendorffii]
MDLEGARPDWLGFSEALDSCSSVAGTAHAAAVEMRLEYAYEPANDFYELVLGSSFNAEEVAASASECSYATLASASQVRTAYRRTAKNHPNCECLRTYQSDGLYGEQRLWGIWINSHWTWVTRWCKNTRRSILASSIARAHAKWNVNVWDQTGARIVESLWIKLVRIHEERAPLVALEDAPMELDKQNKV